MSFSDPTHNIEQFALATGMHVADFGSGIGYYAFDAAKTVGNGGKVYAIDIKEDLLQALKNEAQRRHLGNIEIIRGDVEKPGGTHLRDNMVEAVIISSLLFQVSDKESLIKEAKRILKPKGRALVVDWNGAFEGGPPPSLIITAAKAQALFEKEGFVYVSTIRAGDHHWGFVVRKP